jgi:uncharacterized protein
MMTQNCPVSCSAFAGTRLIASGELRPVVFKPLASTISDKLEPVLIFDEFTSEVIEIDLHGNPEDLLTRIGEIETGRAQSSQPFLPEVGARGPGRPRLGVVAREGTLLPRHWDWLATKPGEVSVALRKLVETARRTNQGRDRLGLARESAHRFISAMAGNEPGFEEAARALFASNQERFDALVGPWPIDVGTHAKRLAARAIEDAGSL